MRRNFKMLVLAACIVLALMGLATATALAKSSIGAGTTGTTTTSTTGTTTTDILPPPYNKPPWLVCSAFTSPQKLRWSKIHSFVLSIACIGLAKQASIQLIKLPKGSSFISKGSNERICIANRNRIIRCWQKGRPQKLGGYQTWQETNLTPYRDKRPAVWSVKVHLHLNRSAPRQSCYSFLNQANNGQFQLSPNAQNMGLCFKITK